MLAQGTAPAEKAGARAAKNDAQKGTSGRSGPATRNHESVKTGGRKAARTIREGTKKGVVTQSQRPKEEKTQRPMTYS